MDTTRSLLDKLKIALNLRSDYALAKYLGVTTVTMSRWREGKNLSDENCIRIADILKLPRPYVIACMHAQSAKSDTETPAVWRQIADMFRDRVALWIIALALCFTGFSSNSVHAAGALELRNNVYYGKWRLRRRTASRKRLAGLPQKTGRVT